MSVALRFGCDGCDATADGTGPLRWEFASVSGRGYGFGSVRATTDPADLSPPGWVARDPYTFACYCPACWEIIELGSQAVLP